MEHILQFAISIDDEAIEDRIEQAATRKVAEDIKKAVVANIFDKMGGFQVGAERIIRDVLNEHKQEIIDKAADIVSFSIKKSKNYRNALGNVVRSIEEDTENNDGNRVSEISDENE